MACSKDFRIKDKHYININYKIPCRYCINCRVDRRKEWVERCYYEFINKVSGTFLTLTYDEATLYEKCIVRGNDEKLRATLNYKDVREFLRNLKYYIKTNKEKQSVLLQEDFKYLGVGEYGENGSIWDRPHWHILLFGIDWYTNKELLEKTWNGGITDAKPILNGGINYVLKYIDKQIMGKEAIYDNYTRYGLEPPKQFMSKGLGYKLYEENRENAIQNNGVIKKGPREIIVPQYYKKKLGIKTKQELNQEKTIESLKNYHIKIKKPWKILDQKEREYTEEQLKWEKLKLMKIKEETRKAAMEKNGEKINIKDF